MNYRYRKKPIVIEAFQMTSARYGCRDDWPPWLLREYYDGVFVRPCCRSAGSDYDEPGLLTVVTPEGPVSVSDGDYIIRGIHGELYPCKPDIFNATYDEVVELAGA